MKKVGLLMLALVLALGSLGVGYASWTDTLYIEGEVNTGSVDIDIVALSGTWVWKVNHEAVQHHGWGTTSGGPDAGPGLPLDEVIASATADLVVYPADGDGDMDGAYVTFDNLYPCKWFMVDILVHYVGTVPARLDAEIITVDQLLLDLLGEDGAIGVEAYEYIPVNPNDPKEDPMGSTGDQIINFCGYQIHECEYILLKLWIHVPQKDAYMGQSGGFEVEIDAIQFNLYDD